MSRIEHSHQGSVAAVKTFSATMARDRESLGERVTAWIQSHPDVNITRTIVSQSSDRGFHCISIVLLCGPKSDHNSPE